MTCQWLMCPVCSSKTRVMLRPDTVLKNFPLYCPKCRQESVIDVENGRILKMQYEAKSA